MSIAPELLVLAPLSIAAGLDLYLTLLFLGASPTLGLWDRPLPGALADLDSPGVLLVVGTMYLLEFAAERYPPASLVWNAFHAVIRPVSGVLLGLLILDGQSLSVVLLGSVAAGVLAWLAHAARSGLAIVRWLGRASSPSVLLVSVFEDVLVVGLVALTLDQPGWAFGVAAVFLLVAVPLLTTTIRGFVFAVGLAVARVFHTLTQRRWLGPEELPGWVRASLEDDDALAPGGALRGSPVGVHRLPGLPWFVSGWLLVRGGAPVVAYRRWGSIHTAGLGPYQARSVAERDFFLEVEVSTGHEPPGQIFFSRNGPSAASLRAEFLTPEENL